jgi:glycosyltransferase involved in cell wall biosynthesis
MTIEYGLLSTHPPTRCGLATFNAALAAQLTIAGVSGGVVRVMDAGDDERSAHGVVHTWSTGTPDGWRHAADALNSFDVAIVQHEYGIYPDTDGADVVRLLHHLTVPSIVVLHTVLAKPSPGQRFVLEQVVDAAGAVVTMTGTGRDRLLLGYSVDASKVSVIPHGVHTVAATERPRGAHLLTWGLLGPGKGMEWTLRALARLRHLDPVPTYTVAGQTHPKVIEREGEAYRESLHDLAVELGVDHLVRYEADYLDPATLSALVASADVVVLPYDSREQVTSGVLIEAVAAGVPVVATAFPHAVELLTDGRGAIVPHKDPVALAGAIRRTLAEPGPAARNADALLWPAVAERYETLARGLVSSGSTPVTVDSV